jgi:hypothetical protein
VISGSSHGGGLSTMALIRAINYAPLSQRVAVLFSVQASEQSSGFNKLRLQQVQLVEDDVGHIMIEIEKRSRMMVSCVIEPSLQQVCRSLSCGAYKSSYVIHGRRIGTSYLRKGAFLHASPVQEPR